MEYLRYLISFVFVIGLILLLAVLVRLVFKRSSKGGFRDNLNSPFFFASNKNKHFNVKKLATLSSKSNIFEINWHSKTFLVFEGAGSFEIISEIDSNENSKEYKQPGKTTGKTTGKSTAFTSILSKKIKNNSNKAINKTAKQTSAKRKVSSKKDPKSRDV